jgi:hypothetical protein
MFPLLLSHNEISKHDREIYCVVQSESSVSKRHISFLAYKVVFIYRCTADRLHGLIIVPHKF